MVNAILAKRVNHIVTKGDNPAWPKGSKSRGFSIAFRKVDTGMTKEMVVVAWGEPYRKSEIKKENGTLETWSFSDNRYVELFNGKVLNVRVY